MRPSDSTYNGWTNYETWVVALWLDNEQSTQLMCVEVAEDCFERTDESCEARRLLAEWLETHIKAEQPTVAGLYADLLNATVNAVNWHELADHYLSDIEGYVSKPDAGVKA